MKKKVFLMLGLVIVVVLSGYWFSVYRSLKNPFDEMYYSETESINIVGLPKLSDVVGSKSHYDPVEQDVSILTYDKDYLDDNEEFLSIYLTEQKSYFSFLYRYQLADNVYLTVSYSYNFNDRSLIQEISIADQTGTEDFVDNPDEIITQLASYGKDLDWLQTTSQTVLEDDILGLWFKKGSHRYSLDNLGDLTITYDDVLSGSN